MQTMESNVADVLYCSFCGKSQHQVKKLIAGPTVFICNVCVDICADIVEEDGIPAGLPENQRVASVNAEYLEAVDGLINSLEALLEMEAPRIRRYDEARASIEAFQNIGEVSEPRVVAFGDAEAPNSLDQYLDKSDLTVEDRKS